MVPSISDLIIAGTLIANAGAVINFRIAKPQLNAFGEQPETSTDKLRNLLLNLRYLRVFIAFWNILMLVAMVIFFGS